MQSPQVLAPDERQIVKIARLDQNSRPLPEPPSSSSSSSSASQADSRQAYMCKCAPLCSEHVMPVMEPYPGFQCCRDRKQNLQNRFPVF